MMSRAHGQRRSIPRDFTPMWDEIRSVVADEGWIEALKVVNHRTLTNIEDYESDLEDSFPLIETLVPSVNLLVTGMLRGSTVSVYLGARRMVVLPA